MYSPPFADKSAIASTVTDLNEVTFFESSYSEDSGPMTPDSQASQELFGTVPVSFNGKSRSAEKVLDKSRRFKRIEGVDRVGTDDTESITPEFADQIKKSVILLKFDCQNIVTRKVEHYMGQAALVRNPNIVDLVQFVTCKHNFGTANNEKGQQEICFPPHECMLEDYTSGHINIPDTGWEKCLADAVELRDGVTWTSGFDVSLGPAIHHRTGEENWPGAPSRQRFLNRLLSEVRPFDVVGDNFSYVQGLKIGIVVFNPGMLHEEAFSEVGGLDGIIDVDESSANVTKGVQQLQMEAVLGEEDIVMIYTGHISFAGKYHIEYDVNTYKGCSGAVVIVMDRGHADFGKAIGIHAGYKAVFHKNIGFKLTGAFDL